MSDKQLNNSLKTVLYILLGINFLLLVWRIYGLTQGTEHLSSLGTPVGFMFLFGAMLTGKNNGASYYVLLAAAMIVLLGSLVGSILRLF